MTFDIENYPDQLDVLINKYPTVFKHLDDNMIHSLPSGWYQIVDRLCDQLSTILKEELQKTPEDPETPLFYIHQIKEKFGGLRFYFQMNTENDLLHKEVQRLVDIAEDTSYLTCQVTGKPGTLCKKGNWYQTLSEESRIAQGYEHVGNGNS